MKTYFAFSDESGTYNAEAKKKTKNDSPFYVRATLIISLEDYITLQDSIGSIKESIGLKANNEVKWSHYGNVIKKNHKRIPSYLYFFSRKDLEAYYEQCLILLLTLKSVQIYFSVTDKKSVKKISTASLMKMHLQNAYQRVQSTMVANDGYAIYVADNLNENNKKLKDAIYEMTLDGDFVQYTRVKKGMYIDCSDHCHGLQMADICAGIFTASLKYQEADKTEKRKYKKGNELFNKYVYKLIRYHQNTFNCFEVYRSGIKEVPQNVGEKITKKMATHIENKLKEDWDQEIHELLDT